MEYTRKGLGRNCETKITNCGGRDLLIALHLSDLPVIDGFPWKPDTGNDEDVACNAHPSV